MLKYYTLTVMITMLFVLRIESMDPLQGGIVPTRKHYSKHWMRYVHKLIESLGLNNSRISSSPLISALQFLQHQIQVKNILMYHYMIFTYNGDYLKHIVKHILYRFKGSGQISFDPRYNLLRPSTKCIRRTWYFMFNDDLRLRIIIHRLRVYEMYRLCNQNVTISSKENITKNGILFCGEYSEFYCYPSEIQVYFNICYGSAPYFYLDITFDIISADIIENYFILPQCNIKYQTVYNIKISSFLFYIYHINVQKFQQLHVSTNKPLKGAIFDGPGYLSKVKTFVDIASKYTISSFQCILIFEYHHFGLKNDNCTVRYSGTTSNPNSSTLGVISETFKYNNTDCAYPLILVLKSQEKTKILITVSQFSFNAKEDDVDCKYGGISFFDVKGNNMHETVSVCTTRGEDQQNLQKYYSDNNITMVVMYSYPEYSSLTLLLHASETHCDVVKINTCAIEKACKSSLEECSTIWQNEIVKIKEDYIIHLTIKPGNENCTVLQFLNNPIHEFPFSALMEGKTFTCLLRFYVKHLIVPVAYEYDISGYLSNVDKYWTKTLHYQHFSAHGFAYKNYPRHSISPKDKIHFFGKDKNGIFLFAHDEYGANIPFKATLEEIVEPLKNPIMFEIQLMKWISWVDFHINKINKPLSFADKVRLSKSIQTVDRIFANKILKISMNSDNLDKNETEFTVTIETQVSRLDYTFSRRPTVCGIILQYGMEPGVG